MAGSLRQARILLVGIAHVWNPLLDASNRFDGFERYAAEIRAGFERARARGVQRTDAMKRRFLAQF